MFEDERKDENLHEDASIENVEMNTEQPQINDAAPIPQGFVLVGEPHTPEEETPSAAEAAPKAEEAPAQEEPVKEENVSYAQSEEAPVEEKKKKRRKKGIGAYAKAVACAVLCGVIVGGCIIGSFAIGKNVVPTYTTVTTNTAKLTTAESQEESTTNTVESTGTTYTVAEIAEQCSSSVVAITSKSVSEVLTMFGIYEQESSGSGSGVIVSQTETELLIVTNYHVIEDSDELSVCFLDSEEAVYSAQIKGTASSDDLAVVAVQLSDMDESVLESISIATIGDSTSMKVGDEVVAIGNALGLGQSVTSGIISALDREVTIDDVTYTLMQTDAAINAGNSGGALFNMQGELIGINTAKFSSDSDSSSASIDNMGFAIPMSIAQSIMETLMNMETRTKLTSDYGCLNITGRDVSSEIAEAYGMPEGVYVATVVEGAAADKAGVQAGDIITGLDGLTISDMTTLKERLQYYAAGETVELTLERSNNGVYEEITVTITLDNASEQSTTTTTTTTESSLQENQNSTQQQESGSYGYSFGR